jgi:uncharacterized protein
MTTRRARPEGAHALAYPPPGAPAAPTFRELTRAECDALLGSRRVARLAYAFHDRVSIEPIHYVYDDGWLVGRTAPGSKLAALAHHPWVALEVDDVRDDALPVERVAHGTFYPLRRGPLASERV